MFGFWTSNCYQTFKITRIDMKILPQLLDLKEKKTQQIFIENKHLMKEIQDPEVATIKCSLVNLNEPVNFDWLPKHLYILDWSENFTTQTKRASANFPTSFYWIWTLDAKVTILWIGLLDSEDTFGPLGI